MTAGGARTFFAAAMDVWGNKSEVVSTGFSIDATPPVITCPTAGPFLLHSADQGLVILAAGYAASQSVDCDTQEPMGKLEAIEQPGQVTRSGRLSWKFLSLVLDECYTCDILTRLSIQTRTQGGLP
jgi:hypothetical protein